MADEQGMGAGSDWQRQALSAARATVDAKKTNSVTPPANSEAVRKRAEAQNVPDMLAAVDPEPASPQAGVVSGSPANPVSNLPDKPVFGSMGNDDVPVVGTTVTGTGSMPKAAKFAIGLAVLLVVVGAGVGGYLLFYSGNKDNSGTASEDTNQSQQNDTSDSVSLSTISKASLVAPTDILNDYDDVTENPDGYFFVYQSKTDACYLAVEIAPKDKIAAVLQGKTADQIIEQWMQSASHSGEFTVAKTDQTSSLILNNADDSSIKYSLPTVYYTATAAESDPEQYAQSVTIMADGSLAMLVRWCADVPDTDTEAIIAKHDAKLSQFTVRIATGNSAQTE